MWWVDCRSIRILVFGHFFENCCYCREEGEIDESVTERFGADDVTKLFPYGQDLIFMDEDDLAAFQEDVDGGQALEGGIDGIARSARGPHVAAALERRSRTVAALVRAPA